MKQIKIFTDSEIFDLVTEVNAFIDNHKEITVKDFKLTTTNSKEGVTYTVMVIYKV